MYDTYSSLQEFIDDLKAVGEIGLSIMAKTIRFCIMTKFTFASTTNQKPKKNIIQLRNF